MPIGSSDGKVYEDEMDLALGHHILSNNSSDNNAAPITSNEGKTEAGGRVLFLIRHGATDLNQEGSAESVDKIRGWTDVPLNDIGREDARKAVEGLKNKGISSIVSSDLSRSKETADIIGKEIGVNVQTTDKLRPWNLGDFTGKDTKDVIPHIKDYIENKPDEPVPGGESFNDFKNRTLMGVSESLKNNPDDHVALVTHHRVERLMNAWDDTGQDNMDVNTKMFGQKGAPPGEHQVMNIEPSIHDLVAQHVRQSVKPEGGRKVGDITNWTTFQGEKIKNTLENLLIHPENIVGTGNLTGIMAGTAAKIANITRLQTARALEQHGVEAEKIFDSTGWFRGKDTKWRFEINDHDMKVKPLLDPTNPDQMLTGGLEGFIQHDKFFENYPQYRNLKTTINPIYGPEGDAVFTLPSQENNYKPSITLGGPIKKEGLTDKQQLALIHEMQHLVQMHEGFNQGAGTWVRDSVIDKLTDTLGKIKPGSQEHEKTVEALNWLFKGMSPAHRELGASRELGFEMYKRVPGEVEARNVSSRFIDPLIGKYPWKTEDYPREKQFDYVAAAGAREPTQPSQSISDFRRPANDNKNLDLGTGGFDIDKAWEDLIKKMHKDNMKEKLKIIPKEDK